MNRPDPPAKMEFPIMPEMFASAFPISIPPMEWDSGFISDLLHNWKLKRIERSTGLQAQVAANQAAIAKSRLDMMQAFITWQARTADIFSELEHKKEIRKAEVLEKNFKNQILYYQSELERLDFERRKRDYEAETRS